jgi:hypothetical protein
MARAPALERGPELLVGDGVGVLPRRDQRARALLDLARKALVLLSQGLDLRRDRGDGSRVRARLRARGARPGEGPAPEGGQHGDDDRREEAHG